MVAMEHETLQMRGSVPRVAATISSRRAATISSRSCTAVASNGMVLQSAPEAAPEAAPAAAPAAAPEAAVVQDAAAHAPTPTGTEDAPVPPHVPFHVAVRVPPPACATLGLPPRLMEGTKSAAGEPDENDATLAHCLTQSRRTPWCDLASD